MKAYCMFLLELPAYLMVLMRFFYYYYFLYKSICCEYSFELPWQMETIQMSTHVFNMNLIGAIYICASKLSSHTL